MYRIGFDVGGTKIEVAVLSEHGDVLLRERRKTERDKGYEHILHTLNDLYLFALKTVGSHDHQVGLGLPGTIHPQTLRMLEGNTQAWVGKDIKTDLAKIFKAPFKVENDANCFALAEVKMGAGLRYEKEFQVPVKNQIAIGVILGTGCGGGIYHSGKILSGAHGGGGEIGHSQLVSLGRSCYCGRTGCAESYVSGPAIEKSYFEKTNKTLAAAEIFKKTDAQSALVVKEYLQHLTSFLANLATIFDPHFFVLGGGLSNQKELYPYLNQELIGKVFLKTYVPKVLQAELGDSAGVIGAAWL
jgi:fructokinase